jgi:hypothetical protein
MNADHPSVICGPELAGKLGPWLSATAGSRKFWAALRAFPLDGGWLIRALCAHAPLAAFDTREAIALAWSIGGGRRAVGCENEANSVRARQPHKR